MRASSSYSLLRRIAAATLLVAVATGLAGCYSNRFRRIEDSLNDQGARLDSLSAEHARTQQDLAETRRRLDETARSLRAGSETTVQELAARIEQLEARLDDQGQEIAEMRGRARTRSLGLDSLAAPGGGEAGGGAAGEVGGGSSVPGVRIDPTAAYDQAVLDFTQGRFELSLKEFRDFVGRWPTSDLADNARYGAGESFYALSRYDSAAVEYRRVVDDYPQGDKVPAALYKLGIAYQRMNRSAEARTTYLTLREKYPRSGEARLAEERLRELDRR